MTKKVYGTEVPSFAKKAVVLSALAVTTLATGCNQSVSSEQETPVLTPSSEPVKHVVWTVEPDMDPDRVYSLSANNMFAGGSWEGYVVNRGISEYANYTADAVAVEKDGLWGFYDYDGNVRMTPCLPSRKEPATYYQISEDCPITEFIDGWYAGEEMPKKLSEDFTTVTEKEQPTGIGGAVPYGPLIYDGVVYEDLFMDMIAQPYRLAGKLVPELSEKTMDSPVIGIVAFDKDGNEISEYTGDLSGYTAEKSFALQYAYVNGYYKVDTDNGMYLVKASSGKAVNENAYEEIGEFTDGYVPVKRNGLYTFLDEAGKEVSEPLFEDATNCFEGKAYVKIDGKYGILDLKETQAQGITIDDGTLRTGS